MQLPAHRRPQRGRGRDRDSDWPALAPSEERQARAHLSNLVSASADDVLVLVPLVQDLPELDIDRSCLRLDIYSNSTLCLWARLVPILRDATSLLPLN